MSQIYPHFADAWRLWQVPTLDEFSSAPLQWAAALCPVGQASKQCVPFSSTGLSSVRCLYLSVQPTRLT